MALTKRAPIPCDRVSSARDYRKGRRAANGSVRQTPGALTDFSPAIAVDRQGNVTLACSDGAIETRFRPAGGDWGPIKAVSTGTVFAALGLGVGDNGGAIVGWWRSTNGALSHVEAAVRSLLAAGSAREHIRVARVRRGLVSERAGMGPAVVCRPSTRPALIAPLLALLLVLAAPAAARADCPAKPLAHTFLPWLDPAWYEAAPNGDLESGAAGWTLAGGAAVVDGNNPFEPGVSALALPAGGSATTPAMCVDVAHPTIRFFARGSGPLAVTVLFRDALGVQQELPVGTAPASADWAPSAVMPVLGNLLAGQVAFRFASAGDWRLDDVFVDPYSKG